MSIPFRTAFWSVAAVVLAAALVFAFRPRAIPVDMAAAERGPMQVSTRDQGRTRVRNEYIISAPVGGQLLRVEHKPGAQVEAGEVVARILPSDPSLLDARSRAELTAAVRSAEATLSLARTELQRAEDELDFANKETDRARRLRSEDVTSVQALDRALLQQRVAENTRDMALENMRVRQSELELARARLIEPGSAFEDDLVIAIQAPVSGSIMSVAQESQSLIAGGAVIMTIGDPQDLEIVAEFLSADAVEIQPGNSVRIENWGRERAPLRGRVRLVEPYGFIKTSALGVEEQRVNVIIDFVDAPQEWASLSHGYRVEVEVTTWETDDTLQVPVSALFRSGDNWAVFRVENDRALLTELQIDRDNGRSAMVRSGIDAGSQVVLFPGERIADRTRVTPRE